LSEVPSMKSIIVAGAMLLASACMEKSADGTYHVSHEKTQTAADNAKENAKVTGDAIKQESQEIGDEASRRAQELGQTDAAKHLVAGAKEIGTAVKEGSGEAAEKAGAALQRAGHKLKTNAQDQETTTTTSRQH
jgi:hypothetical protein